MRLIDADMLMKEIQSFRCSITGLRAGKGVLAHAADEYRKSILQIIDDQPTAFDKEKVIADLAKCKESAEEIWSAIDSEQDFGETMAYMNAIRVVEKGGLN